VKRLPEERAPDHDPGWFAASSPAKAPAAAPAPNFRLVAFGLAMLAGFVVLFLADRDLYARVIDLWSFRPFHVPFLDWAAETANIRCWRLGVDVYATDPCDIGGRLHDHSPLWLRLPLPWVGAGSTPVYGLTLAAAFLGTLAVLPRPPGRAAMVVLALAVASPDCVFALERGNPDLLIFCLAALAILGLDRRPWARLFGYAAIIAGSLLKFYPAVLFLLSLRERPAAFVALAAVFGAVLAWFVGSYHGEIALMFANVPRPLIGEDAFGNLQAPTWAVLVARMLLPAVADSDTLERAVWTTSSAALHGAAALCALRLGRSLAFARSLRGLTRREGLCLVAGAALVCGCFLAGANLAYRAVHLLFVMPALLALGHADGDARVRRLARWAIAAALGVLWSLPVQRLTDAVFGTFWEPADVASRPLGSPFPGALIWGIREALWWFLLALLLAVLLRAVMDSPPYRWAMSFAKRRSPADGEPAVPHPD
jgi:hypothetical protein